MSEQQSDYKTRSKTIFRVEKNPDNPFVMIDRRPIENPKLSWKAKGILAYLISRPDDWVVRFRDLVNRAPDGGHTVRAAMKELRAAGHVKVTAEREGGRVKQWVYTVHELPDDDFQQVEKQQVENRRLNNNKGTKNKKPSNNINGASAKPKAADFPELVLYREVTELYPVKASWHSVVQRIFEVSKRLGRQPTREDLFPFYEAWCNRGWLKTSVNWLDYAIRGEMPNGKFAVKWNTPVSPAESPEDLARRRAEADRLFGVTT